MIPNHRHHTSSITRYTLARFTILPTCSALLTDSLCFAYNDCVTSNYSPIASIPITNLLYWQFVIYTNWISCLPSGTRLDFAIARSWVRIPPVAAVHQRLLSVPSLWGRLMSSSLQATGRLQATGWRPSAADWGSGMSVVLRRGSTSQLSRAVDGCIPRHGIISSCQSAATSRIVKRCCSC